MQRPVVGMEHFGNYQSLELLGQLVYMEPIGSLCLASALKGIVSLPSSFCHILAFHIGRHQFVSHYFSL